MRVTQFSLQFVFTQLLIIAAATVGANDESFVRVWLTRKAFDHLVSVGGRVMNAIIPDIRVERGRKKFGSKGGLELRNLRVSRYRPPDVYDYALLPPDRLQFNSRRSDWDLAADFSAWAVIGSRVEANGSVTADVRQFSLEFTPKMERTADGELQATDSRCAATVGTISLNFKAEGSGAALLGLYKPILEEKMKKAVTSEVCKRVQRILETDLNSRLSAMGVVAPVNDRISFDLLLTAPPAVSLTDGLATAHRGEVEGGKIPPAAKSPPTATPAEPLSTAMVFMRISAATLNSYLSALEHLGNLTAKLNDNDTPQLSNALRTSCTAKGDKFCFGSAFPGLSHDFPSHKVEMEMILLSAPVLTVKPNSPVSGPISARLTVKGLPDKSTNRPLWLTADLGVQANAKLNVSDNRLHMRLRLDKVTIKPTFRHPKAGSDPQPLDKLAHFLIPTLQDRLNQQLGDGLPLPGAELAKLTDVRLNNAEGHVVLRCNFVLDEPKIRQRAKVAIKAELDKISEDAEGESVGDA